MNPISGEIFLDKDFPVQSELTKPLYTMVVCNVPQTNHSVLFALIDPFADSQEAPGPDWEWPERFVVPQRGNPLNRATAVMLDDIYRGNGLVLKKQCEFIGSFDTRTTTHILRSLSESPGVEKIYADIIRDAAGHMDPDR